MCIVKASLHRKYILKENVLVNTRNVSANWLYIYISYLYSVYLFFRIKKLMEMILMLHTYQRKDDIGILS